MKQVFIEEEKPLVFNIFRIEVFDTPINYVTPQRLEDREISRFESPNVSGEIQVLRGYRSEDDLLLVSVPFGEKTILITRSVQKGADGEAEDMVKGLSFDK